MNCILLYILVKNNFHVCLSWSLISALYTVCEYCQWPMTIAFSFVTNTWVHFCKPFWNFTFHLSLAYVIFKALRHSINVSLLMKYSNTILLPEGFFFFFKAQLHALIKKKNWNNLLEITYVLMKMTPKKEAFIWKVRLKLSNGPLNLWIVSKLHFAALSFEY